MNIRCPECSTNFDLSNNPEDEGQGPREVFCPGCGHGFEPGANGGETPNKTQLGAMGHIDAVEDAPGSGPQKGTAEDEPTKTQMGKPTAKIPSPGQVAADDDPPSKPESSSPDYNPFPHAKEDVATPPGRPTPGQEEPPVGQSPPGDTDDTADADDNPSDPSFGAVEAGSGESTTSSTAATSESATSSDSGPAADEDDFWSSASGDEYDAFAPEGGMDPSFDEDREFFDPDAPGSRTGGSQKETSQKSSDPQSRSDGPQSAGETPSSAPSQPSSEPTPESSSTEQSPKQPPSPGIRSEGDPQTTHRTPGEAKQPSKSPKDRSWTGDDDAAARSTNSPSLAQKIAYLALIVLLVVNGLLGWIAYKNAWMIDFVKFEQMLEVAFEGGTYEPREEWTKE